MDQLTQYFDGVLKLYQDEEIAIDTLPEKTKTLVNCLLAHKPPPNDIIEYSCSTNLWPNMTFDQDSIMTACDIGALGYLQWLKTWFEMDINALHLFAACAHGHLHVAQWLVKYWPEIDQRQWLMNSFYSACLFKHYHVANWMVDRWYNMKIHFVSFTFYMACKTNKLELVKWLITFSTKVDTTDLYDGFIHACQNNNLEMIKLIFRTWPALNFRAQFDFCLCAVASRGYLEILAYLLYKCQEQKAKPVDYDHLFGIACEYGRKPVAKWLLKNFPFIDPHYDSEYPFVIACRFGQLEMAQWLKRKFPTIDHRVDNDYPLCLATVHNHSNIVEWYHDEWGITHQCSQPEEDS